MKVLKFISIALFMSNLLVVSSAGASPIFDNDRIYPNMWVVNEATGEITPYSHNAGTWVESFSNNGIDIYQLQADEQVLINNLGSSSIKMTTSLAPISISGLGAAEFNSANNIGSIPLTVLPSSGSFDNTIAVQMSVDSGLFANENDSMSLAWTITGANTGEVKGNATLTSEQNSLGRLITEFYLVKDDTYQIQIDLTNSTRLLASKNLSYTIASSDPDGERRDSDNDGLPDLVELAIGLDPLTDDWTTDSDNNGWSDFDQWLRSTALGPNNVPLDSDNDGWSDFDEGLRGTNPNDLVTALVDGEIAAPTVGTEEYKRKLLQFKDVPAATSLYEVEYLFNASLTEIVGNTEWESDSLVSYGLGKGKIFNVADLLTDQQLSWADSGSDNVPERRKLTVLQALLVNNSLKDIRLPAGQPQILDLRGTNSRLVDENGDPITKGEAGGIEELRSWHLLHWLGSYKNLTPDQFTSNNVWQTAEEWRFAYVGFLQSQLVVDLQSSMGQSSTSDTLLMMTALAQEHRLRGNLDSPIYKNISERTAQTLGGLNNALALRENNRTLNDVFVDLQSMSASGMPLQSARDFLQGSLASLPWRNDYIQYFYQQLNLGQQNNDSNILGLFYLVRLSLFEQGLSELLLDSSLQNLAFDSDSDGLNNQAEVSSRLFQEASEPWSADTDGDGINDKDDVCPADELDTCQTIQPILNLNSSFSAVVDESGTFIIITAQLSRESEQDVSVDFEFLALAGDSATPGEDFEALSGTIVIPAGELIATVFVAIPGNTAGELEENFHLVLTNPQNVILNTSIFVITLTPDLSADASLSSLSLSSGGLSPTFDASIFNYNASLANNIVSIQVTATTQDPTAMLTINGVVTASADIPLNVGLNTVTLSVTSQDLTTINNYSIDVVRAASLSNNADLLDISLSDGVLTPIFTNNIFDYNASVNFLSTSIGVTPTLSNLNASVSVNGVIVPSGAPSEPIILLEGDNIISLVVLAEDGVTSNTYTIVVNRQSATTFSQQAYVKASNMKAGDRFGYSVALDGTTLVVGAYRESSNATGIDGNQADVSMQSSGAVYVFTRDNANVWTQQAYIKASNTDANDEFGYRVALSGNTLAVSAYGESSSATGVNGDQADNNNPMSGAVYIFTRDNSNVWSQQAYIKSSNAGFNDYFGSSLALSTDTLAVGANGEASAATGVDGDQMDDSSYASGAAYLFSRDVNGVWSQQAYLKASNTGFSDAFGSSIALADNILAVGASGESSNATGVDGNQLDNSNFDSGAVYVYANDGLGSWNQQAYIKASNSESSDQFGRSIALSGSTLVVGAPNESSLATGIGGDQADNSSFGVGAVYVFVGDNLGGWTQQAYIKASNSGGGDYFGTSVALVNDVLAVGAEGEGSSATGTDGDQTDDSMARSGAAYTFIRNTFSVWAQQVYIKSSNTDGDDVFGNSIALTEDLLVIGASVEASNATGIDGNQADNSAFEAGAVYVLRAQ